MDTGYYISGIGHGVLIGWALLGGLFSSVPDDNLTVANVSIITADEFAALSTPKPVPDAPDTTPAVPEEPVVETPPEVPPEEPTPPEDTAPEVTEITPPPPVAEPDETVPQTPQPPAEETPVVIAPPAPQAVPRPSVRVTPDPVAPPPPDVAIADQAHPDNTPAPDAQTPPDPDPPAAPEASSDRIIPETLAPARSARPSARPRRPAPPVETARADPPATLDATPSIDETLRQLQAEETAAAASSAPTGPPLSRGQKDAFLLEVRRCWNVGALSTAALQAKVVVRFELGKDGKPNISSIRMTGYEGGSEAVAKQAYETARRAIIRCGTNGYNLPAEKYEQWKIVNITFNPENMRLK